MRAKNPPLIPFQTREEREQTLREFIVGALGDIGSGRSDAVLLLARSPESPAVAALLALSDELARRRLGAAIVLAGGAAAAENETWSLSFSRDFLHEIRLTSHPRVLDAHEQLVVGDRALWYGDCMRRDPLKRDAYCAFLADDPRASRSARFAFGQLWQGAQSIYRSAAVSCVIVAAGGVAGGAPAATTTLAADPAGVETSVSSPVAETLAVWQPSTRH